MTVSEAASRLKLTRAHLSRILNGHSSITAEMSLRLSVALGTSPDFWLKMQGQYDIWRAGKNAYPEVQVFPMSPPVKPPLTKPDRERGPEGCRRRVDLAGNIRPGFCVFQGTRGVEESIFHAFLVGHR